MRFVIPVPEIGLTRFVGALIFFVRKKTEWVLRRIIKAVGVSSLP